MNEMNGTVTLAYVEEDNRQRVIFRVIPLCTREGVLFHGTAEEFPDQGSLRIVPDKREQSTFKERMRSMTGYCAILLPSEGKEMVKVRQNRNYSPENGESNQYAIYSDVICEFAEDACFEVIEFGEDASRALTSRVLIFKDKMLYGPVDANEVAQTDIASLKPFGNDSFLLHTVEVEAIGSHRVYWNPEMLLTWRQRRNGLRKKEKGPKEEPVAAAVAEAVQAEPENVQIVKSEGTAAKPETEKETRPQKKHDKPEKIEKTDKVDKAEKAEKAEKIEKPARDKNHAKPERKNPKERKADEAETPVDSALPIGTRLEILDTDISFEQQISRLAQPLSDSANRLSGLSQQIPAEDPAEDEAAAAANAAHFTGTELNRSNVKTVKSSVKPDNIYHLVDKQLRTNGTSADDYVTNPIENLRECVEGIWQNHEMRTQAIAMLMQNEAFAEDMASAMRKGGINLQMIPAAQEQLSEIEADRIALMMQLNTAREDQRQYANEAVARLNQKRRDEAERLRAETARLKDSRDRMLASVRELSNENAQKMTEYIAGNAAVLGGIGANGIVLSPVIGKKYDSKELAEILRVHLNDSGYSISEDDALCLMISFGLFDTICMKADNVADAYQFASVMIESFGLKSVSAVLHRGTELTVVDMLKNNDYRTPTVSVQPITTDIYSAVGHKTILISDGTVSDEDLAGLLATPVFFVPAVNKHAYRQKTDFEMPEAAALSVFSDIRSDTRGLLPEAEKWFDDLRKSLEAEQVMLPEVVYTSMRRFVDTASYKIRGGFPVAADSAVCQWIVSMVVRSESNAGRKALENMAFGLNKTKCLLDNH